MEYCPYDSAFEITQPIQEKKKKRKQQQQQKQNLEVFDSFDPDRPALANKTDILSLQTLSEAFVDISSNFVAPKLSEFKALPKYFLNGEDDFAEPFTDVIGSEEPTPPSLPLIDNWKPVTPSNSYTAFFNESAEPDKPDKPVKSVKFNPYNDTTQQLPKKVMTEESSSNDIVNKIDLLFKRLDALEKECKGDFNPNNQKELLYFVGTGFVFLVGIHLLRR